jgi:hypothetical protein
MAPLKGETIGGLMEFGKPSKHVTAMEFVSLHIYLSTGYGQNGRKV